jgi:DNA polymerase-4
VAAASYEARTFGIHSAQPTVRALRLCPHAILVKPRHSYYAEISRQIRDIYSGYTDLIEPISLDECFLDVTLNKKNIPWATQIAHELKLQIKKEIRLTASAGVAPNKFLAKIASDMNKPDGLTVVKPGMVHQFLRDLPVNKIWGVGKVTASKMESLGIRTIGELARVPIEELERQFGKAGHLFAKLARGEDDRPVQPFHKRKSISQETTFASDISEVQKLKEVIARQAAAVSEILHRKDMLASTITLKIRYDDFTTITRSHTLPFPIDDAATVTGESIRLLEKTDAGMTPVRLVGVGVSNLVETGEIRQLILFNPLPPETA